MTSEPIQHVEEIEIDTAYSIVKAAETLDAALEMAIKLNDTKSALEVANGWLTIAAMLDEEEPEEERRKVGFYHDVNE